MFLSKFNFYQILINSKHFSFLDQLGLAIDKYLIKNNF